jgi:general stress protein 26
VASDASWVEELAPGARVNAAIIASGRNDWVSVSGTATVRIDAAEIEELWSPAATAYFEGPEDPRVGVLHIAVEGGEYWDAPGGGPFGRLLSMISAKLGRDEQNEQGPIRGGE